MNKLKKAFLISLLAISAVGTILTSTYTYTLATRLDAMKRNSHAEAVYLRTRIRELESELTARFMAHISDTANPDRPVSGNENRPDGVVAETLPSEETSREEYVETEHESESGVADVLETEEVTLPTHMTPETQTPEPETAPPVSLYVISEYNGRIGVFDASGSLVRTVNVFVMTLPKGDREALEIGIPAYSWEEAVEIMERYE